MELALEPHAERVEGRDDRHSGALRQKHPDSIAHFARRFVGKSDREDAVRRALKAIRKQGVIADDPQVIRIEKN